MATSRKNVVILVSEQIKDIKYVNDSLMVTKDQPYKDIVNVAMTDGAVTITVDSGRKKTAPIAVEFGKHTSKQSIATQGGGDGKPDALNFTFGLDVTFKDGKKTRLQLGQGNRLFRNNWWFGSTDLKIEHGQYQIHGNTIEFIQLDADSFDVGGAVKNVVPKKYGAIFKILDDFILKDLSGDVNVFKIGD